MPFLIIAGIEVNVLHDGATERTREVIGSSTRSFSGKKRSTVRATKRSWSFRLGPLSTAEVNAIIATTDDGAFVNVSGDAIGGTVLSEVLIGDMPYIPDSSSGNGFVRTMDITISEV